MSRIDDLIGKYAPGGVEYKTLGDVAAIAKERVEGAELDETTYVGVDNLLSNFGGRKASAYGANSSGAIQFREGDVLLGNIRPYLKKVWLADRDGGASPDVLTVSLTPHGRERLIPRFFYYVLASDAFISYSMKHAKGAKMPRGDKKATLAYRTPVPPLEVQREIASVLDAFMELEAELEAELDAELEARKQQYAHYRDLLLTFSDVGKVRWTTLGEIASVRVGQAPAAGVLSDRGEFQVINAGATASGRAATHNTPGGTVTIPSRGQGGVGIVGYQTDDFWCGPLCYRIRSAQSALSTRFLYYFLKSVQPAIRGLQQTGGTPALNRKELVTIRVPFPTVAEQERIVRILGSLDPLVNDLSWGLPTEVEARRQQYAHYRDRLLTFEEGAA